MISPDPSAESQKDRTHQQHDTAFNESHSVTFTPHANANKKQQVKGTVESLPMMDTDKDEL